MANDGGRYLAGAWPSGDVNNMKHAGADRCNSFGPSYYKLTLA
jgi:hypothetical protein